MIPKSTRYDALARALADDSALLGLTSRWIEPARVRRVERVGELGDERDRPIRLERALGAQDRRQVRALDVAHRDVQQPVDLARLVDRHDARMLGRRRQPRLAQEPLTEPLIVGELGGEQLQRDLRCSRWSRAR